MANVPYGMYQFDEIAVMVVNDDLAIAAVGSPANLDPRLNRALKETFEVRIMLTVPGKTITYTALSESVEFREAVKQIVIDTLEALAKEL